MYLYRHNFSVMINKTVMRVLSVLMVVLFFSSCEKEIDLNIQGADNKLVVQADLERQIDPYTGDETGFPPIVVLTKSISFFGDIDSAALSTIFIHDAEVYVSDGSREIKLREYDFRFAPGQGLETAYIYTIDTASTEPPIFAEFGTTYTLRIEWQGETYTSTSTLLPPVAVDSFWIEEPRNFNYDTTYYQVRGRFTDPPERGQNYYYQVNSLFQNEESTSYEEIFNDEVTNGVSFPFTIAASEFGEDSIQRGYFIEGDTVEINWSSIDFNAYEFFNTKNFSEGSIGNPFATPVNVIGNISNGALGAFITKGTYTYKFTIEP